MSAATAAGVANLNFRYKRNVTRRILAILLGMTYGNIVLLDEATMLQVEIGWRLLETQ